MKRVLAALAVLLANPPARAMTVDEAYRAIPHDRTVFDTQTARMDKVEADYLQRLFDWIDQAIVAKMSAMENGHVPSAYEKVWALQAKLRPPAKLQHVQDLVGEVIKDQYAYLKEWQQMPVRSFNAGHPRVRSASQKAHRAYGELMASYPAENAHNKKAFFDYLCALDFF